MDSLLLKGCFSYLRYIKLEKSQEEKVKRLGNLEKSRATKEDLSPYQPRS
jgi:hypothetical protein